jgi:CHAT domain-containing protein
MAADVVQLSYALGVSRAYLWVRDRDGVRVAMLSASRASLEQALENLYLIDRVQAPRELERAIANLADLLLPPDLRTQGRSVEIVTDGRLSSAPFLAMLASANRRLSAGDGAVTMIGSVFNAAPETHRAADAWRLVSLGADARSGGRTSQNADARLFPELTLAAGEGDAVREIWGAGIPDARIRRLEGSQATIASLATAWRQGAEVVHLATHGLADLRQPLTSLLEFPAAEAGRSSTYLTAGQIQLWRGDVGLVYLSACETAQGPERFAVGMQGLHQAFLNAGARHVIATLWAVEDRYAKEFALDFYRRLKGGEAAPRALAATQRAWMSVPVEKGQKQQERRRVTASAYSIFRE